MREKHATLPIKKTKSGIMLRECVCVCVCVCVREKERERERERERELDVPGTQHVARSSTVQQQRYHIMLSEALPGLRELCCVCVVCV